MPDLVSSALLWCHDTKQDLLTSCNDKARCDDVAQKLSIEFCMSFLPAVLMHGSCSDRRNGVCQCIKTSWGIFLLGKKIWNWFLETSFVVNYFGCFGAFRYFWQGLEGMNLHIKHKRERERSCSCHVSTALQFGRGKETLCHACSLIALHFPTKCMKIESLKKYFTRPNWLVSL